MKKIRFFLIPLFCLIIAGNILAYAASDSVYEFTDENKIVTFDENCTLTSDEQLMVAERLVYGSPEDSGIQTYAWCWLTGHDYLYNAVAVITHEASDTQPRCLEETYEITTCSKCDYMAEELLTTVYIICCD